ncbi:carcinoembryonic antigen-related cell adhesion molecule 5 [Larimichthys crocea]|nr:carcinoembryonic antigen-related cell adhesion molecule 5-like [Larimichthys crocea]
MDLFASRSLLLLLSLLGRCSAADILPEGPVSAILGKNVTLKTLLTNPTYDYIIWNFSDGTDQTAVVTLRPGSVKVSETYEGRVSADPKNGFLTLTGLRSTDSGDYSMSIISPDITKTAEIRLQVLEPVSDVTIKSDLPEAIEFNSTVVLTCSAKGSFLKFSWLNGTAPIVADGKRLTLKDAELSSTLTITGVLRSDLVGPIYCKAANQLEMETSAAFNLTVYYGPDDVAITPANPPAVIKAGSNFSLSCSARSDPPATFSWYHNQTAMEVEGPVLTLEKIQKLGFGEKAGEYTCRAKNAKTERVVPSAAAKFSVMDPIKGVKMTAPTAVLIAGNSSANLSCQAAAGNVEATTWLKDGRQLTASERVVFAADMSSVKINPLQKEDNGEYVCELSNPVNKAQDSYKMVVNYGPEQAVVTGEGAIEFDDRVTLTCSAASVPPANFTWKFNGTLTNVKTATYSIEKAVYKNSGTYMCQAHNAITGKMTTSTHNLSVKEEGALDGLSDGAIAGIVIGVLIALALAIGLIIYCRQKVPVESPY